MIAVLFLISIMDKTMTLDELNSIDGSMNDLMEAMLADLVASILVSTNTDESLHDIND